MRAFPFLVLALCACRAPREEAPQPTGALGAPAAAAQLARLELDASAVAPGQRLRLRLHNLSARPLFFNLCTAALEQVAEDGGWLPAPEAVPVPCTMVARQLEPGQVATEQKLLPRELPAGSYRYSVQVTQETRDSETVSTASFTLGRALP
jgi:hypothetical protein